MNKKSKITLLKNGWIIDGTNSPRYLGDVLLHDDKIASIDSVDSSDLQAQLTKLCSLPNVDFQTMDCSDSVISPGFIDVHTHDDAFVLNQPSMLPKLSQGITTVIVGNCGISLVPVLTNSPINLLSLLGKNQFRYVDLASYAKAVDAIEPAVNVAALIGHTALRIKHLGVDQLSRAANAQERALMCDDLEQAMKDGALGLSSGVFYAEAFQADAEELIALAQVAARSGGVYTTHIRDELAQVIPALQEAAQTAKQANLPLILSHHKCAGHANWGRSVETLALIDQLAKNQQIALDVYPYIAGSTVLRSDLVDGVIQILITNSQTHPEMIGRYLVDIAKEWNVSQVEACERLKPGGACYFQMSEDDVERIIAHPLSMIGSDGLPHDERPHPRLWGAFPRVLAHYCRSKGILPLEQAVYKMTGLSAKRFHLANRGELKAGFAADLVVFDPHKIQDKASFENPTQISEGIHSVWVNGQCSYSIQENTLTARSGRFLRRA